MSHRFKFNETFGELVCPDCGAVKPIDAAQIRYDRKQRIIEKYRGRAS